MKEACRNLEAEGRTGHESKGHGCIVPNRHVPVRNNSDILKGKRRGGSTWMSRFAERLKALRLSRGMNQEQLAAALGISRSAIAGWEAPSKHREPRRARAEHPKQRSRRRPVGRSKAHPGGVQAIPAGQVLQQVVSAHAVHASGRPPYSVAEAVAFVQDLGAY